MSTTYNCLAEETPDLLLEFGCYTLEIVKRFEIDKDLEVLKRSLLTDSILFALDQEGTNIALSDLAKDNVVGSFTSAKQAINYLDNFLSLVCFTC